MTMALTCERRNLILFLCRHPAKLISLPINILFMALLSVSRRIISEYDRMRFKKAFTGSNSHKKLKLDIIPEPVFERQSDSSPQSIMLANSEIVLDQEMDWHRSFADIEDIYSLHRFGWLLTALLDHPSIKMAEKAIHWIDDWITCMEERKNHPSWESYSVAERLSNWPFILRMVQSLTPIPESIMASVEKAISDHIDHLISHVEFRGAYTNNHILNNARGLYIGGILLNDLSAVKSARKIFLEWTEKMFSKEGMLKEHSSHYQYLMCQRYEQIFFLAQHIKDYEFCVFLSGWLKKIKEGTAFFDMVNSKGEHCIPLIGDISPDFTPNWLLRHDQGWAKFKKCFGWQSPALDVSNEKISKIRMMETWIRYQSKYVNIFWHIQTDSFDAMNHGHYDFGSFALYIKGEPVIIDPGLYSCSKDGSYGKSVKSHSTVMIDSLGAFCEDPRIRSLNVYPGLIVKAHLSKQEDEKVKIELFSNGFCRFPAPITWKRIFTVESDRLHISDSFQCDGYHLTETRFQIHPDCMVASLDGDILISCQAISIRMLASDHPPDHLCTISSSHDSEEEWFSGRYGYRSPGKCLFFKRRIESDHVSDYEFRWH